MNTVHEVYLDTILNKFSQSTVQLSPKVTFHTCPRHVMLAFQMHRTHNLDASHIRQKRAWHLRTSCWSFVARFCVCMDASCAFLMHFVLHTFQTRTNVTMEINCTTHFGINWTYEQTNSQKDLKETCMHNKATLLCTNLCSFLRSSTFGRFTCSSHISSGWWVLPASLQQALHQCDAPASVAAQTLTIYNMTTR